MNKQENINWPELVDIISYNEITGLFIWRERPEDHYRIKSWNKKYAGTIAGTIANLMGKDYINIQINGTVFLAHRLAWFYMHKSWPDKIDHIDGDGTNNSISNLRYVSMQGNQRNRKQSRNNTSGVTGVYWAKRLKKWGAQIKVSGRSIHLGFSNDKFECICLRKSAENSYGFHRNHGSIR